MIDTLKLRSPYVSENVATAIESRLHTKVDIDNETGECLYEIVTGNPEGSWEVNPHVNVLREEWVSELNLRTRQKETFKRKCAPYVVVEGSVHKALCGHNVYGGPLDPVAAARWYVRHLGRLLGVVLPDGRDWLVLRIDWAEVYALDRFEAVSEYLHGVSLARYPRRSVNRYGDECVMFSGRTTAFKFYHKGPEFSKHDFRRIKGVVSDVEAERLQRVANGILRAEVSIKSKKLMADYGLNPPVYQLDRAYLEFLFDRETDRVLHEGKSEMETVRTNTEVRKRLDDAYGNVKGTILFRFWLEMSAVGEDEVKRHIPRTTFYRQRKELSEAGVSWSGTDVQLRQTASLIPAGFSPVRKDPRRMTVELPEVTEALRAYA